MKVMRNLIVMMSVVAFVFLQSSTAPIDNTRVQENGLTLYNVYCSNGNPTSDYITITLWNSNHSYVFQVPPGAPAGYVMGQIAGECGYSVRIQSSGAAHSFRFYWVEAQNVQDYTYSGGGMCLDCSSCPSLYIF